MPTPSTTTMVKKGIIIGMRDVIFALLTEDDADGITYGDMLKVPGSIEAALTAQVSEDQIGADDIGLYEVVNSLDGFDVSLTVASVGNDGRAFLLGGTSDTKGVRFEKASDTAPYVAMGFKAKCSDGTDDYVWLYKGRFAPSDETYRTKEKGKVNWQTPVLKGKFIPRINDQAIRCVVNTGDSAASTILSTFFSAPYATPST